MKFSELNDQTVVELATLSRELPTWLATPV